MSACSACLGEGVRAGLCALHFLSRVAIPAELDALGLHDLADKCEAGGCGILKNVTAALAPADDIVMADVTGRTLRPVALGLARWPWPANVGDGKSTIVAGLLNALELARTLRMVKDGTAAGVLAERDAKAAAKVRKAKPALRAVTPPPRVPHEDEEVTYVAPGRVSRKGAYELTAVRA